VADVVQVEGPSRAVRVFGVRLVGMNAENGKKLLFSMIFVVALLLMGAVARRLALRALPRGHRADFWARQSIKVGTAILMVLGLTSLWFDDPTRLTTALGLVTAGLAFALQKVVTAVAGYVVIARGKIFNVGDRIVMGGVRGDVIALDFTQTTIMEMGQPPPVQGADPAIWVQSRQYTGRVVSVSNMKIFDEPIYNYTRAFPYLWEELVLPISYGADRTRAEEILLAAAARHTVRIGELSGEALAEMQRRYLLKATELTPTVYYRLTDNWLELTVRFIAEDHGVRRLKDAMTREILGALDEAGIGIASATLAVVELPAVRLSSCPSRSPDRQG
jgi:small-conductance mechanosensitive channel